MKLDTWINPQRARLKRFVIVAAVVFVGLLLSQAIFVVASPVVWAILGAIWAAIGVAASNWFTEGRPW
jgi:uncharacterized protein YaaW (UPF0174 family)